MATPSKVIDYALFSIKDENAPQQQQQQKEVAVERSNIYAPMQLTTL